MVVPERDETTQFEPELVQLGDFRLGHLLGAGGMGAVYEGVQLGLERKVAVKILKKELAGDPAFVERFRREAKVAGSLVHRNLIQVYKVGEQDGVLFFGMEYVDGSPVSDSLRRGNRLPVSESLRIVIAVAEALRAGQIEGVIHRDIKPENIMLARDGEVKLGDLGLAKRIGSDADVTRVGEMMGTPYYMAPEQAVNTRDVDFRADIYSLGISLFHMVTGKRPFTGDSPISVAMAHSQEDLPSASQWGMAMPKELETLIERMTAKTPDARQQTYDELIEELDHAADICRDTGRLGSGRLESGPNRQTIESARPGLTTTALSDDVTVVTPLPGFVERSNVWFWLGLGTVWTVLLWWGVNGPLKSQPIAATDASVSDPVTVVASTAPTDGQGPAVTLGITRPQLGQTDFPPLPMVDSPSLLMAPLASHESDDAKLAKARHYAQLRPWALTRILVHYDQIWRETTSIQVRATVEQEAGIWVERLESEIADRIATNTTAMKLLLTEGKPRMAYDVWRKYEPRLRTPKSDWEIYRIITNNIPVQYRRAEQGYVPVAQRRHQQ